jgi:hypothetical protein
MDYYQGVVTDFLRADRAVFVNPELPIQLARAAAPKKGPSWYCDVAAVNLRERRVYLCEVTYSTTLHSLLKRLQAWSTNWPAVCSAIRSDSSVPNEWKIQPWVFIPKKSRTKLEEKLMSLINVGEVDGSMPRPRITDLEEVAPWEYPYDRTPKRSAAAECSAASAASVVSV